jgi:hypothetical protein
MNDEYPVSGMTEQQAMDVLKEPVTTLKEETREGIEEYRVVARTDMAIVAFCRDGKVYSVCIQAPFSGHVEGVRIGDSESDVLRALGQPTRIWPVVPEKRIWFFDDRKAFLRVDFNPEQNNRVEKIYV